MILKIEKRLIITRNGCGNREYRKRERERKGVHETKGIAERRMARRDRVSLTLENGEENGERKRERGVQSS